jgi:hypothetical protein
MKQDSNATIVVSDLKKKNDKITLWSEYTLSNWFFLWVFPVLKMGRFSEQQKELDCLKFEVRKEESARINVDLLDKEYHSQPRG